MAAKRTMLWLLVWRALRLRFQRVSVVFAAPVIYLLFDRLALWTKSRFARHEEEA